jgi:hypothetical protein
MMQAKIDGDEARTLLRRFAEEPDTLTEEEKFKVFMILDALRGKDHSILETTKNDFFEGMVKFLAETDTIMTNTIAGVTALLITFLEALTISHVDTFQHINGNRTALDEIAKQAETLIQIPDDVDDGVLMIGLIHAIGNRLLKNGTKLDMNINYAVLSNVLGLNKAFINECPGCQETTCSECPKKGTVDVNDTYIEKPKNPIEDVITQTMSGLKDAVKSVVSDQISSLPEEEMDNLFAGLQEGLERKKKEVLSQEESSDNTEKPVSNVTQPIDIRERLKNNKR